MPHDLPPWHTVYQQSQRWRKAKVFEALVHDLREVLRVAQGRNALPSAAIVETPMHDGPRASSPDKLRESVAVVRAAVHERSGGLTLLETKRGGLSARVPTRGQRRSIVVCSWENGAMDKCPVSGPGGIIVCTRL